MSTATLAPADLVIADLEEHFDDVVPCFMCVDAASVRVTASCCKVHRTMCPVCLAEWRAKVDAILRRPGYCKNCLTEIPAGSLDWYRVVPL